MTIVHIENTVQDFDTWKVNFDKYERFRAEQGVQSYRVSRSVTEPNEVLIDLEFCDDTAARAFLPKLEQIMNSPQAQTQLVRHSIPRLFAVVTGWIPVGGPLTFSASASETHAPQRTPPARRRKRTQR